MTAAAEPCTLARHWCETLHPENAIAQLKQNGVRALALQGRIVTREAVPLDCALHCADANRHIEREYGEPMVIDAEYEIGKASCRERVVTYVEISVGARYLTKKK